MEKREASQARQQLGRARLPVAGHHAGLTILDGIPDTTAVGIRSPHTIFSNKWKSRRCARGGGSNTAELGERQEVGLLSAVSNHDNGGKSIADN